MSDSWKIAVVFVTITLMIIAGALICLICQVSAIFQAQRISSTLTTPDLHSRFERRSTVTNSRVRFQENNDGFELTETAPSQAWI